MTADDRRRLLVEHYVIEGGLRARLFNGSVPRSARNVVLQAANAHEAAARAISTNDPRARVLSGQANRLTNKALKRASDGDGDGEDD